MPEDAFNDRMIDIAAGRVVPKRGEPKIWFHSLKSATEILSDANRNNWGQSNINRHFL